MGVRVGVGVGSGVDVGGGGVGLGAGVRVGVGVGAGRVGAAVVGRTGVAAGEVACAHAPSIRHRRSRPIAVAREQDIPMATSLSFAACGCAAVRAPARREFLHNVDKR